MTAYVGSLADGAIARVNLRTGDVRPLAAGAPGRVTVGVDYERGRHRIWAAGGATSEVRAYDARTGALLQTYHLTTGFLNDVVVTRRAVYVTDSNLQQLIVVPLGRHGRLPDPSAAFTLPLTGDIQYAAGFNANGIVGVTRLADPRPVEHRPAVPREPADRRDPRDRPRRRQRLVRRRPRGPRLAPGRRPQPAQRGGRVPARRPPRVGAAGPDADVAGPRRAHDRRVLGRPAVGGERPVQHAADADHRVLDHPAALIRASSRRGPATDGVARRGAFNGVGYRGPTMLEILDLTKRYGTVDGARRRVVHRAAAAGSSASSGPNGAGKTTTMRCIFGLAVPDARRGPLGRASRSTADTRLRFGYMPEQRGLYPRMRVGEQLSYFGQHHGLSGEAADAAAGAWLERFGPGRPREVQARGRCRTATSSASSSATALVHDPELLVLDEPFSGLDPIGIATMTEVLRERAAAGVGVVFSSHQLDLVEDVCEDVVIIARGRIVADGRDRRAQGARRAGGTSRSRSRARAARGSTAAAARTVLERDGDRVKLLVDESTSTSTGCSPRRARPARSAGSLPAADACRSCSWRRSQRRSRRPRTRPMMARCRAIWLVAHARDPRARPEPRLPPLARRSRWSSSVAGFVLPALLAGERRDPQARRRRAAAGRPRGGHRGDRRRSYDAEGRRSSTVPDRRGRPRPRSTTATSTRRSSSRPTCRLRASSSSTGARRQRDRPGRSRSAASVDRSCRAGVDRRRWRPRRAVDVALEPPTESDDDGVHLRQRRRSS